jgi:hypothetical protein
MNAKAALKSANLNDLEIASRPATSLQPFSSPSASARRAPSSFATIVFSLDRNAAPA